MEQESPPIDTSKRGHESPTIDRHIDDDDDPFGRLPMSWPINPMEASGTALVQDGYISAMRGRLHRAEIKRAPWSTIDQRQQEFVRLAKPRGVVSEPGVPRARRAHIYM